MAEGKDVEFSELLAVAGATQVEILEWLTLQGFKTSIHSIRAWSRGTYRAPEEAVRLVAGLAFLVQDTGKPLPEDAPAGVVERRNTHIFVRERIQAELSKVRVVRTGGSGDVG